jgi:uncharacterized protein YdhG (YjbR/CyaY superfamily)
LIGVFSGVRSIKARPSVAYPGGMPTATVDDYIAAHPAQAQLRLHELRAIVRSLMPDATESISYGLPTYKSGPTRVYFGAAKHHCALYGTAWRVLADEVKPYLASRGTVRFPLDQPVPEALARKLILATIQERQAGRGI